MDRFIILHLRKIDEFFDLLRFCVVITNLDNSPAAGAIEAEGEFNVAEAKSHVDEVGTEIDFTSFPSGFYSSFLSTTTDRLSSAWPTTRS